MKFSHIANESQNISGFLIFFERLFEQEVLALDEVEVFIEESLRIVVALKVF
jgi:hypothetical protein